MRKVIKKIGIALLIILIAGYLVVFYPLTVSVDQYGETVCHSLIGLSVGC